jgi:hypothetical protein
MQKHIVRLKACWPGVSKISTMRNDGRSQRLALANNLRADATDISGTVHGAQNGRGGAGRQGALLTAKIVAAPGSNFFPLTKA